MIWEKEPISAYDDGYYCWSLEEGVPKESGYYVLYLGKNKLEVAEGHYCRVPVYKTCMYDGMTPFPERLVAWRKLDLLEDE